MGRIFEALALLAAVAGLSACALPSDVMPKDAVYKPDDDSAVVILGQAIRDKCAEKPYYGYSQWIAHRDFGPGLKTFHAAGASCEDKGQPAYYSVLRVPPGEYLLSFFQSGYRNGSTPCRRVYNSFYRVFAPSYEEAISPKFPVKKGEVIYIGEITYSWCEGDIVRLVRNDAAARRALNAYPNFKKDFVFRPLVARKAAGAEMAEPGN